MSLFPPLRNESSISINTTRAVGFKESKLQWLGDHGPYRYAKRGDQEYACLVLTEWEHHVLREGEFVVSVEEPVTIDGMAWSKTVHRLAVPVQSGTWAKIEERRKAREARKQGMDRPLRTWSALDGLLRSGRRDPTRIVLAAPPPEVPLGIGEQPYIEVEPKTLDASPAGLLKYFADKGVELTRGVRDGTRLLARSRLQLSEFDRTLLHRMEPLLVAELGGPKVLCTECDKPAVQPVEPRAWACREHSGE